MLRDLRAGQAAASDTLQPGKSGFSCGNRENREDFGCFARAFSDGSAISHLHRGIPARPDRRFALRGAFVLLQGTRPSKTSAMQVISQVEVCPLCEIFSRIVIDGMADVMPSKRECHSLRLEQRRIQTAESRQLGIPVIHWNMSLDLPMDFAPTARPFAVEMCASTSACDASAVGCEVCGNLVAVNFNSPSWSDSAPISRLQQGASWRNGYQPAAEHCTTEEFASIKRTAPANDMLMVPANSPTLSQLSARDDICHLRTAQRTRVTNTGSYVRNELPIKRAMYRHMQYDGQESPVIQLFASEAAPSVLLMLAALGALVISNSPHLPTAPA